MKPSDVALEQRSAELQAFTVV